MTLERRARDGGDVVIEPGAVVWIDEDVTLGTLIVRGELRCGEGVQATFV